MRFSSEILLSVIRFVSKLLATLPLFLVSPEKVFLAIYLVVLFGTEVFLMSKFGKRFERMWVVIFSSAFSYVVPVVLDDGLSFMAFLITDIFSVITLFYTSGVIGVVMPGLALFFANLPLLILIGEVTGGRVKPYREQDAKMDFIRTREIIRGIRPGDVVYADGEFLAKIIHEGESFLFRAEILDDSEIVTGLLLTIVSSSLSAFFISHAFRRRRLCRERANGGVMGDLPVGSQDVVEESEEQNIHYLEYLKESLERVRESVKSELELIERYEKEITSLDAAQKRLAVQVEEQDKRLKELVERFAPGLALKRNCCDLENKLHTLVSMLEDLYGFSRNLVIEMSLARERMSQYEREVSQKFRELESVFHEIFSPLGGVENQISYVKAGLSGVFGDYYDEFFRKCDSVADTMREFVRNLGEIYESFHILHLNSQVRAHKIRDKVPSFEVIPQAIHIMLEKMKELMANVEVELRNFEEFVKGLKGMHVSTSFTSFLEDLQSKVGDVKSVIESIVSAVSSLRLSFVSNIKVTVEGISKLEEVISSVMVISHDLIYDIRSVTSTAFYVLSQVQAESEKINKKIVGGGNR